MVGMVAIEIGMSIPLAVAVDLDEAHSAFDQAPGHETFGPDVFGDLPIQTVELERFLAFAGKVGEIAGFHLHPVGEFKTLDAREQIGLAFVLPKMIAIDLFEEIKLRSLVAASDMTGAGQVEDGRARRTEERALIASGQKARAPV